MTKKNWTVVYFRNGVELVEEFDEHRLAFRRYLALNSQGWNPSIHLVSLKVD
jgi:hypothetical protein